MLIFLRDPENYPSQKVSEKSDVYSYGVVLLELITGRKTKVEGVEGIDIVIWAKPRIEYTFRSGDFTNLVDPKLQMNCIEEELRIMVCCATACVYKPSHFRPPMKEIVRALEGYMNIKDIWDEKNDNKFLSDNPKPNGSHNVDEFQHTVPKALVISEAINGIKSRKFTQQELMVTTNGPSNTTEVTKKFQAYFEDDYKLNSFTYQELIVATRGFSEDNRLDEGPLGQVYKGDLNGEKVTVKKFNNPRKQEEEYKKMKAIGSSFHHRNVVNLIGYCEEGANRLLVYDFIAQGKSFRRYLRDGGSTLPWITRIQNCILAADIQALLHTSDKCWWDPSLDWMDIYLLGDDDLEPKLAEYGREKFFSDSSPHKSNSCMAPEYTSTRMFTQKTSVYSCGVMLIEMITGEEAVDAVLQWTVLNLKVRFSGNYYFVDKRLKDYNKFEMDRMVACSLACLRDNPQDRPEMSQIVEVLKGNLDVQDL
ncbi:proline-rich receptor-like protein kinase PERK2 [Manihot esculenta]|uniref:proline-rich receptor-like protein kinase PERK2 n=1 Tax=Manihot esculenta TaxID=3983 RepID=UPI001CC34C3C|nr:proline-rich receptor-like protein kinase PERK2 [Manihot esculenta]